MRMEIRKERGKGESNELSIEGKSLDYELIKLEKRERMKKERKEGKKEEREISQNVGSGRGSTKRKWI